MPVASSAPPRRRAGGVGLEPRLRHLPSLLLLFALWALLVVGRGVCLLAQRLPPLLWLVRAIRQWRAGLACRPAARQSVPPRPRPATPRRIEVTHARRTP